MILLWGLSEDRPLAVVRDSLEQQGVQFAFLDQSDILETEIELRVNTHVAGAVRTPDQWIDLGEVTALYLRPHDARRLPEIASAGEGSQEWLHAMNVEDVLMSWSELTPALVINRPMAMATNSSKPYQAARIRAHGFQVPETLITTDPQAVMKFRERHEAIIYKSISGIRSIVSRLTEDHLKRLEDIVWCPTQFQQYIPGNDYRVHVIGHEIFTCQVISEADDYRYASQQESDVEIYPYTLPEEIADRCLRLVKDLGLTVAGVDLRRTPEGCWYCFEVNPSPGFTYYQEATGQPIDKAITKLLAAGNRLR